MITHDRRIERAPSTGAVSPAARYSCDFIYPTLRQALYRYLAQSPPARVLLPDYVPEGIYAPVKALGAATGFYHVPVDLRLRKDELAATMRAMKPDVVVLIHYFGAYIEENVTLLRELAGSDTLLVEDFAHTVHETRLALRGDICLFSHTKVLGVAEGGGLVFANPNARREPDYSPDTPGDRTLKRLLGRQLLLEHLMATRVRGRHMQALLFRAMRPFAAYYPFLCDAFTTLSAPVSGRWSNMLKRIDLDAIAEKRRALARRYVENLRDDLCLPVARGSLLRNTLYGFPVRVHMPEAFHSYLVHRGVRGQVLCDRWWFDSGHEPSELYRTHYLLPVNHHLSASQVDEVIAVVNSFGR
ncbi:MAG: hypothetical protein GF331_25065 [Chitinivibrionales bacterium]|nr:hypothetical protein [Chitinivibrionales bacterium]